MDTKHTRLRALAARYDAAETSVAEERELRALLAAPDLPEELHGYRAFLGVQQVLAQARPAPRPAPWDQPLPVSHLPLLARSGGRGEKKRGPTAGGELAFSKQPGGLSVAHRRPGARILRFAAAAAVLIACTVALLFAWRAYDTQAPAPLANNALPVATTIDWSRYEVTDPAEAARVTRAALATVSQHLEAGSALTGREVARIQPIHNLTSTN